MSDIPPPPRSSIVPPPIPPVIPPPAADRPTPPDPSEMEPVTGIFSGIEAILRQPRRVIYQLRQPGAGGLIAGMAAAALACFLVYGFIVGTFSGGEQYWAAPLKVTLGALVAALICLPSLYIFACLGGSRASLTEIAGMVAGLALLTGLLLIGLAPVAWLFSESTGALAWMGALHLLFWFVATSFGLRFLQAAFEGSQARSHAGLRVWTVIYVLVVLQMTTALRPLLGTADTFLPTEKMFFLTHWGEEMDGPGPDAARVSDFEP